MLGTWCWLVGLGTEGGVGHLVLAGGCGHCGGSWAPGDGQWVGALWGEFGTWCWLVGVVTEGGVWHLVLAGRFGH